MRQKQTGRQDFLPTVFRHPLTAGSNSAKARTNAIAVFFTADMQPYSVVDNYASKCLYNVPQHVHFSQSVDPALYK